MLVTKIFDDPTPNNIICKRIVEHFMVLLKHTELNEDIQYQAWEVMVLVGKKLIAVWTHRNNYNLIEDKLIEEARKNPIGKNQTAINLDYSQELFLEFDNFLVQVKSCLDYLVKFPAIIIGKKVWNLRTFGSNGNDVIKALKNNLSSKYENLVKLTTDIIENNKSWLSLTIEARDKINHFIDGGFNFERFAVYCHIKNSKEELHIPMWAKDQSIRKFLEIIWANLFNFTEYFTEYFAGCFVGAHVKKPYVFFHGKFDINSSISSWKILHENQLNSSLKNKLS